MKISIFGAGYVGLTTAACLANLGHEVLCFDVDEEKIRILKEGKVPFYEPGLKELISKNKEKGRLRFITDLKEAVVFADVIFSCVGTPSKEDGSADLSYVYSVAKSVGEHINEYKIIVNKSTVPPGTARETERIIKENLNQQIDFDVVSNPEFLREGNAIRAFNLPDKIVIGSSSERPLAVMRKVYSGRLRTYLPMVETDWETAELIKYANNTFLATKISFINEMANICERVGADVKMVSMALGLDYRVSPRFLNPGVGYGGSCFPKDVKALISTSRKHGYEAKLFEEVDNLNERQKDLLADKVKKVFNNDLSNKTLCILGLSFKPRTSDMRDAPSIKIIEKLLAEGAKINVYDPVAIEEAKKILPGNISFCSSINEAVQGSSAILLVTEWDEFRTLDLSNLRKMMVDNKLFDGRNVYEPEMVKEEGFEYYGIGRK